MKIMSRKTYLAVLSVLVLTLFLVACGDATQTSVPATTAAATSAAATSAVGTAATTSAAGTTAAATNTAALTGETVYFGVSGPQTGQNAEYGRIWKKGFDIALDEINSSGGIKGHKLDLIYEDSQSDPKQSVPIAQKFVNDKRILAELGDFSSPASMAASSIYQRAKVVQFGFTNSHPDFTKGGDFMFSPGVSQEIGATKLAEHTVQTQGKKLAVLYLNTDWGKVTSQIFVDKAKALGANIVASEAYLSDEKDFRPILSKVRDTNPEVLVLISYYADGSLILKQAESTGLKAKVIAAGSTYSPQFISLGGSAVEGVVIPTNFFPDSPRPEIQTFVNLWRKRYNEEPNSFAIGAYDALKILAWAADKGNLDRVGIQQALLTGKNIPSILLGPFSFAEDRRPAGDYVDELIAVKDGKFVHYDNKNP